MTEAPPRHPPPTLPPAPLSALLLDLDGTLLDFAPTPQAVLVPPDLPASLARLARRLDGALAIITGRPVAQVEALLPGLVPVIAGEHGAALRPAPDAPEIRARAPNLPPGWLARAESAARGHPGSLLEIKPASLVLHFRGAPAAGAPFGALLAELAAEAPGFHLVEGAMAWELRPRGIDKGGALRAILDLPAFAGRRPVFIGDDVTDQDAIAAARALGGVGLLVAESFGTPEAVRAWLRNLWAQD